MMTKVGCVNYYFKYETKDYTRISKSECVLVLRLVFVLLYMNSLPIRSAIAILNNWKDKQNFAMFDEIRTANKENLL